MQSISGVGRLAAPTNWLVRRSLSLFRLVGLLWCKYELFEEIFAERTEQCRDGIDTMSLEWTGTLPGSFITEPSATTGRIHRPIQVPYI
jgi:hypothetical protein